MAVYTLIAGVNGAGKSTLYGMLPALCNEPNINVDAIVRELGGNWRNSTDIIKAGKVAISRINSCFEKGLSFSHETTLTGKTIIKNIDRAVSLGYEVRMIYVGIGSADMAAERVKHRVSMGGHGIPDDIIKRRFADSLRNLKCVESQCSQIFYFDNSETMRIVAIYADGELRALDDSMPGWLKTICPGSKEKI